MTDSAPTPEERNLDEEERNIYRFEGFRYQLQSPPTCGPNDVIPQIVSLYAFPKRDAE